MNIYTGIPHPEYPSYVWSDPTVEAKVLPEIAKATTPKEAADNIMAVLNTVGYDSMDREQSFWIAFQTKGFDYEDIYDAWLAQA